MTKLTDLFGDDGCGCTKDFTLEAMIAAGYVRTQRHPTQPLTIYNYTPKTQYEKVWNDVTKQCRGLIVHDDGSIVARPFPKFFNWGEVQVDNFNVDAMVTVTDKADGSLGILYRYPDGTQAIATRGSFTSEQALKATAMLNGQYAGWELPAHLGPVTVLFEIIYPANRIVLDYQGAEELRLIEAVWIDRGWPIASDPTVTAKVLNWPGPVVEHLGTAPLKVALSKMVYQRKNAEGVVIRFLDTDDRYKIKQDDYVALHRVLTGTSARVIWSYLAVNACKSLVQESRHWQKIGLDPRRAEQILVVGDGWLNKMLSNVPDEFYAWVRVTSEQIRRDVADIGHTIERVLAEAQENLLSETPERAGYRARLFHTLKELSPRHHGAAMALYDGRDQTLYCWKSAYPGVDNPFMDISEDTA